MTDKRFGKARETFNVVVKDAKEQVNKKAKDKNNKVKPDSNIK